MLHRISFAIAAAAVLTACVDDTNQQHDDPSEPGAGGMGGDDITFPDHVVPIGGAGGAGGGADPNFDACASPFDIGFDGLVGSTVVQNYYDYDGSSMTWGAGQFDTRTYFEPSGLLKLRNMGGAPTWGLLRMADVGPLASSWLCLGAGSTASGFSHSDVFRATLDVEANLGACANGTPASGSVVVCTDLASSDCPDGATISGDVDGMVIDGLNSVSTQPNGGWMEATFGGDGYVSYSNGDFAIVRMPSSSADPGAHYCAEDNSGVIGMITLGGLARLGTCAEHPTTGSIYVCDP